MTKRVATKRAKPYVDKQEMLHEILHYRQTGTISEQLHLTFYQMAQNISMKGNWRGYTWREDMVQDAYLKCVEKIDKFNPDKFDNPFAYFTTLIFNTYMDYIGKEKKFKEAKSIMYEDFRQDFAQQHGVTLPKFEDLEPTDNECKGD